MEIPTFRRAAATAAPASAVPPAAAKSAAAVAGSAPPRSSNPPAAVAPSPPPSLSPQASAIRGGVERPERGVYRPPGFAAAAAAAASSASTPGRSDAGASSSHSTPASSARESAGRRSTYATEDDPDGPPPPPMDHVVEIRGFPSFTPDTELQASTARAAERVTANRRVLLSSQGLFVHYHVSISQGSPALPCRALLARSPQELVKLLRPPQSRDLLPGPALKRRLENMPPCHALIAFPSALEGALEHDRTRMDAPPASFARVRGIAVH